MLCRTIIATLALYMVLMSSPAFAQQSSLLDAPWKFQLGGNPAWALPNFDDSQWGAIEVPSIIPQQHGKPTQGWYRVHFDASINGDSPQALLIEYIRHADETWLNGIKIGGEGHFEQSWQFIYTNPQGLTRLYPIPQGLLKAKDNVLSIKISIGFGSAWGAMFPGGAGIIDGDVYLGDIEPLRTQYQQSIIISSSADMLFLTLSLVDLLIILLLLRYTLANARELKWLAITSLFMFMGAAGHDLFYLIHLDIHLNLLLFIALAGTPVSMAMYFWAQYRNLSQRSITIIFILWLCAVLVILLPIFPNSIKTVAWYTLTFLITCFFLYSFFCVFKGIRLQRPGATAQFIALACYLVLIRTQWLPDAFLGHRNIQLGSIIYRYALLFAYFQQISSVQIHYKKLLFKVITITDDVRNAIARDLHDGIGQHLASIKLQSQLATQQKKKQYLNNITVGVDAALLELRRIVNDLRPIQINNSSISEAIKKESNRLAKAHNISIELDIEPIALNKNKETHVFRIFQEAIGNSIQHGKPTKITVYFKQHGKYLYLNIIDNGLGFDTHKKENFNETHGFGHISLSERAAILDAQLSIMSKVGSGSQIKIKIPLFETN